MEIKSDAFSCWCFLRHLWQTENHPGVDLCKTELSHQTEPVHGPVRQTERQREGRDGQRYNVKGRNYEENN